MGPWPSLALIKISDMSDCDFLGFGYLREVTFQVRVWPGLAKMGFSGSDPVRVGFGLGFGFSV